jgi:hypothetical protein
MVYWTCHPDGPGGGEDDMELTTSIDHLVGDDMEETMAECGAMDEGYPLTAVKRAIAVMFSLDHPRPLTGDQVAELLERIEQEGNRLLGREA